MDNENINVLRKHYNQHIYPKPTEDIKKEFIDKNKVLYADPNFSWHKLWPEKKYSTEKLSILIAGCGSDQAAILAMCNPRHDFFGVDLSKKSLDHQNKLIKKHQINNLTLFCNDFRLLKFDKKFDYIISTGVIHHLDDPSSALKYFNDNLNEDGVIDLMVYGDKKSYAITQLKKIFNKLNLNQDLSSINLAKNIVNKLHNKHPVKIICNNSIDFKHSAGIVDLLLHKKETFYSIKDLVSLLSKNNLIIKNFFNGNLTSITKFFLDDEKVLKNIRNLSPEEKWELGQILNWDDRNIEIVCCKKNNFNKSLVYNPINFNKIYTYMNRSVQYNINKQNIIVINPVTKQSLNFTLPDNKDFKWELILNGEKKLSDIMNNFDESYNKNLHEVLKIMIENSLLDISYFPIVNYYNYYNK